MRTKLIFTLLLFLISFSSISAQDNWKIYSDDLNAGAMRRGNYTQNFCEDKAGNLWVSTTKGGILNFKNDKWSLYDVKKISFVFGESPLAIIINSKTGITSDWETTLDKNGKWVWFGSSKSTVLWNGSQMLEMTGNLDNERRMIFNSNEKDENYIIKNNQTIKIKHKLDKDRNPIIQIHSILNDSKNRLWLGSWEGMIYCLDKGIWHKYDYLNKVKLASTASK